jgi:hypothetical protein
MCINTLHKGDDNDDVNDKNNFLASGRKDRIGEIKASIREIACLLKK